MTQQYTPAQLEAWAGLGPWRWQETRTNFETETALVHKDAGIVLNASWRPSSCEIQVSDPDSEALIASAPNLARLVLEKEKEIARLKAANYAAFTDGMEAAAQICGTLAEVEYDDADGFEAATGCEAAIMQVVKEQRSEQAKPRQAMKETSDDK